jgi:hypothetical protein
MFLATAIRILREYERGIVFTLGRFTGVKGPGLIILIPFAQQMVKVDLRVVVQDVPPQDVIMRDNVTVKVNAVLYFRIVEDIADVRFVPFREEGWAIAKEDEARACAPGAAAGFSGNGAPKLRWHSGIVPIDRGTDRDLLMARIRNRVGEPLFQDQSAAAIPRIRRVRRNSRGEAAGYRRI